MVGINQLHGKGRIAAPCPQAASVILEADAPVVGRTIQRENVPIVHDVGASAPRAYRSDGYQARAPHVVGSRTGPYFDHRVVGEIRRNIGVIKDRGKFRCKIVHTSRVCLLLTLEGRRRGWASICSAHRECSVF